MNAETGVLLWSVPQECSIEMGSGYDAIIGCAKVVLVSTSYSRCSILVYSSLFSYVLWLTCFIDYIL